MPNLIHSLDANTLIMLRYEFSKLHSDYNSFYSVHDCFAVTADKVRDLIILIRSIYTKLYIEEN
jgi:DNA-directed RNA polymerase